MDIYQTITDKIIAKLEKGIIPWMKPWAGIGEPVNHNSGRGYSMLNQLLLAVQMTGENNQGKEYLTFNQCAALGGKIKKGEKSSMIVFWNFIKFKEKQEDGTEKEVKIPFLKHYNVFEVGQCEGIERKHDVQLNDNQPIESAETIVKTYFDRETCHLASSLSDRAFYAPTTDYVRVPDIKQFKSPEEYYSTLFHEMVHSTGHETRLNRFENTDAAFGSNDYSKEELVAELGSCFLSNQIGISTSNVFRNSTAYIQNWLGVLKGDKKLIVSASSKAEAAVKYINNGKGEE